MKGDSCSRGVRGKEVAVMLGWGVLMGSAQGVLEHSPSSRAVVSFLEQFVSCNPVVIRSHLACRM